MQVVQQNEQLLTKLENFTGANLQHETEKGTLNSEAIMALSKYVMDGRAEKAKELVGLQQKLQENQEQIQFAQRQLQELAAGSSKTERDAVIVVDKKNAAPGKVRLNYLVDSASWRPQYKFRAGKGSQPVQAGIPGRRRAADRRGLEQRRHDPVHRPADAQRLAAGPEDARGRRGGPQFRAGRAAEPHASIGGAGRHTAVQTLNSPADYAKQAQELRGKAQKEYNGNNAKGGGSSSTRRPPWSRPRTCWPPSARKSSTDRQRLGRARAGKGRASPIT